MGNSLISVVMGVFNGASYLAESIQSVLNQSCRSFEFIVVNDGSTDARVGEILSEFAAADERIRVINQPNAGLTQALIKGCAAANGLYIARIDVGDRMSPNFLTRQYAVLSRSDDLVFASCWTLFCGPQWEPLYTGTTHAPEEGHSISPDQPGSPLKEGPTCHGAVMFRRDAYVDAGGYRGCFYFGQDMDLWYRLSQRGRFAVVPEVLYQARIFPDSISAGNRLRQKEIGACSFGAMQARLTGMSERPYLKQAALIRPPHRRPRNSGEGAHFIAELLRRQGDARCRHYFCQALKSNPFRINSWIRFMQTIRLRAP